MVVSQLAYKLLASSNSKLLPSCSNLDRIHSMWNSIWNLEVPHKVKHMIWRASHNALPTLCNLRRQKVVGSVLCASCNSECEDVVHALWGCASLILVWERNEAVTKLLRYKFLTFTDLWEMLLVMRDRLDINLMAMIFWLIWSRRNTARVGEGTIEVNQIQKKAESFLQDFKKFHSSKVHRPLIPARVVRWIPPIFPLYKVNFDGATFSTIGAAGLGAILRDHSGNVIGTMTERIQLPSSLAVVEAMACRRALLFAKELSIFEVSVEGDAEVIIMAILAGDTANLEYGHVISDILSVAKDFRSCIFSHVNRIGNTVAHCLAKKSVSGNELQVWIESSPDDIAPLVTRDSLYPA
ncbi:hypothetical protein SO802_024425 [Lithocarpus litseifolius]|uniref:Reverse transcriptase zinc-binding domain-containing protein n=1 Tax=Lithocarpus litseifolius TaxID=425828 RepID=A0AAW2C9D6_9ROSI